MKKIGAFKPQGESILVFRNVIRLLEFQRPGTLVLSYQGSSSKGVPFIKGVTFIKEEVIIKVFSPRGVTFGIVAGDTQSLGV